MPRLRSLVLTPLALLCAACGTGGQDAERYGSTTEGDTSQCAQASAPEGIDVSGGQGTVDWSAAKGAGIAWTIMKATQGLTYDDTGFAASWPAAKAAGVARGAYHFFDPTVDGAQQAAHFLKVVGPLEAEDLSPMLDVECPNGTSTCLGYTGGSGQAPVAEIRQRVLDFVGAVEAATGRKPIVYTYESYFSGNQIDATGLDAYPLWIADLVTGCFKVPTPWTEAALWQYTFTGTVSGVTGQVDRDRSVGFLDELRGWPAIKHASRADVNGDGKADVCGRDPGGLTCAVSTGSGFAAGFAGPAWSDAAGWRAPQYASTVQLADIDGDGKADACGRGAAGVTCASSTGSSFGAELAGPAWSDAAGWNDPARYATLQLADVTGDGKADVCARGASGITCAPSTGTGFGPAFAGPAWSDAAGWNVADRYRTIRFPDLDGDGKADVCGRGSDGLHCSLSTGSGFGKDVAGPAWRDAAGWGAAAYASTIQFPDVNGDGQADVCARAAAGITCALWTGGAFGAAFAGPAWSDAAGWSAPSWYGAIVYADLDGDGRSDVCGRASDGVHCALSTGSGFGAVLGGPAWTDAAGWGEARYYGTIGAGDVNGDGREDLCARGAAGVTCAISNGSGFGATVSGPAWSDAVWGVAPYWGTTSVVGGGARAGAGGDAGADAGEGAEAGVSADGGANEDAGGSVQGSVAGAGGCHCRASGRRGGASGGIVVAGVFVVAFWRRRQRAVSPYPSREASSPGVRRNAPGLCPCHFLNARVNDGTLS